LPLVIGGAATLAAAITAGAALGWLGERIDRRFGEARVPRVMSMVTEPAVVGAMAGFLAGGLRGMFVAGYVAFLAGKALDGVIDSLPAENASQTVTDGTSTSPQSATPGAERAGPADLDSIDSELRVAE
jgi:hypothetical protein